MQLAIRAGPIKERCVTTPVVALGFAASAEVVSYVGPIEFLTFSCAWIIDRPRVLDVSVAFDLVSALGLGLVLLPVVACVLVLLLGLAIVAAPALAMGFPQWRATLAPFLRQAGR